MCNFFRFIYPIISLLLVTTLIQAQEWTSPHDLKMEEMAPVTLIPFPTELTWDDTQGKSRFLLSEDGSLSFQCKGDSALYKNTLKAIKSRLNLTPVHTKQDAALFLELTPTLSEECGKEGYLLTVSKKGVELKAATEAGLFYGVQTLGQLAKITAQGKTLLPAVTIKDKPAFAYRGFMHDTGRNYQTIESLKKQLDQMSRYKINVFQWHLTDSPAWRPESKIYPQLNDPKNHGKERDQGEMYTFDQIRDLISFAKERHILVIPELDMPGHSTYFKKTFGFEMATPQGMDILEKLLDEFCDEISQKDCPILHIGTDEVHVKDPKGFVQRMVKKVHSLGRSPVQWKPGLPMGEEVIAQLWSEGDPVTRPENKNTPYFDSSFGYANGLDNPYLIIQRYFFKQLGGRPQGDKQSLGPILCLWPDVRVDDKAKIERHSPQWPAILAFAERAWKGAPHDGSAYVSKLPASGTEARKAFDLFEKRMFSERHNFSTFPYFMASHLKWKITLPVSSEDTKLVEETRKQMLSEQPAIPLSTIEGGCLMLRPRTNKEGIYPQQQPKSTVWARMELDAPRAGKQSFIVGFDAPSRSSRKCSGIPQNGQWSNFGAKVWVNGKETTGPSWENPGGNINQKDTWLSPANEIPYTDEEFWWTRKPVELELRKGHNTLLIEIPYEGTYQSWGTTLIPVKKEGTFWVTDEKVVSLP